MQTHVHANERPSRFLTGRIEGFREVLSYFAALPPRQIAFLLQLEFWDWEMDEIIYAVRNFEERAAAWCLSGRLADEILTSNGILLAMKFRKKYAAAVQTAKVTAPVQDLDHLIDCWNELLTRCEAMLDQSEIVQTVNAGGRVLPNLAKFRKQTTTVPSLSA
jgi:hypothetical protein